MQVPVPVVKEPREWPPMTHMIVMAGFRDFFSLTAVLALFANLADPPSALDFPVDDDATFEELQRAQRTWPWPRTSMTDAKPCTGRSRVFRDRRATRRGGRSALYTVNDGEDMPVPVRAVLLGGVLLFLIRMLTNGLDLAALL